MHLRYKNGGEVPEVARQFTSGSIRPAADTIRKSASCAAAKSERYSPPSGWHTKKLERYRED